MSKIRRQKPSHIDKQRIGALKDALEATKTALGLSRQEAMLDPLLGSSGTLSRKAGEVELGKIHAASKRDQPPYAVLFFDLDHFKAVNDSHGHAAGDEALKHVSALLNEYVREGDWVFRYGGEEIGVILPNCPNLEAAQTIAEGLRARLAATPCNLNGTSQKGEEHITLTTSIGVALSTGCTRYQEVVDRADRAVYRAKGKGNPTLGQADDPDGRNRVCAFREENDFFIVPRGSPNGNRIHSANRPNAATPAAPVAARPAPAG